MTSSHATRIGARPERIVSRLVPETEGSSRLDRERAASVADEGGVSAARLEARGFAPDEPADDDTRMRLVAALLVLGALVVWILFLER
jgi:hypothetical protein